MEIETQARLKQRYEAAVDSFVDKVRNDPNLIAVIVNGSLAYDVVWEKSDIDMTLVVRDQPLQHTSYSLVEDGITINANLYQRSQFKRGLERAIGGSFSQSYYAKGKIVYTTDDSLYEYFEELRKLGSDDIALSAFFLAAELVHLYNKCLKWLTARNDPLYAQYYLLMAAEPIAHMEQCLRGEPASRESIQKAITHDPAVMTPFYQELMARCRTVEELGETIGKLDDYLMSRMDVWKKPVLEYLADGEIKTFTVIAGYFRSQGDFLTNALDYLAEKGVIEKVSQTIRLTPKSKQAVEEIGYLYIP